MIKKELAGLLRKFRTKQCLIKLIIDKLISVVYLPDNFPLLDKNNLQIN